MNVTLQDLTKIFPGRGKGAADVVAVDHMDLQIPDGCLIGLLGPSGCGKSTVLNLLSGLLSPTGGKIFFGEEEVTHLPPEKRGVGLVFQSYALYPHLTVRQNILFPLQNLKGKDRPTKEQMLQKVQEAANLVQIGTLMDRKPSELSGGQQQRVAIARALVKMPKLLLLDEPLSNLDARLRLQTREELRRIQNETGITTIFVTHDQEEAMSICDLIVVMKDGKLHQIGKPQDIYDDPEDLFVAKFLGTPPISVFSSQVRDGQVWIGDEAILPAPVPDQEVWVGIRPEGFQPDPEGPFTCQLRRIEVMGRDISVICGHEACQATDIRAIISSRNKIDVTSPTIRFRPVPEKVDLFAKDTELRIRW